MKSPNKRRSKILAVLLAVFMLLSAFAVQASAFVNVIPDQQRGILYASNPISDIGIEIVSSSEDGSLIQTPSHISVLGATINSNGSNAGTFTTKRPSYNIPTIRGKYSVEGSSSRIWTAIGKDATLPPSSSYNILEGFAVDCTVRFDTYVVNRNMGSEINFDLVTNIYQQAEVDVASTYSGNVSYPKKDGSLGNVRFDLSYTNSYKLSSAPDGTQSEHIKVRHFTSPTPLYANQNPDYIDFSTIYRHAYEQLDDVLKEQYVAPETIERWIYEENHSFQPVCSNYVTTYKMTLKGTDKPILSDRLVAGTYGSENTWVGTYGNYLAINSELANFKATATKYDFTEVITSAINNTMNIQIFPDFTIGEIFLIVGGLGILTLLLKIFLGG